MKLKTTAILAACGVLMSAAGAFAIPVPKVTADPSLTTAISAEPKEPSARMTAGDTLLVDARLGHASLPKSARGETFLFAQVTASEDKSTAAALMNLAVVIDR